MFSPEHFNFDGFDYHDLQPITRDLRAEFSRTFAGQVFTESFYEREGVLHQAIVVAKPNADMSIIFRGIEPARKHSLRNVTRQLLIDTMGSPSDPEDRGLGRYQIHDLEPSASMQPERQRLLASQLLRKASVIIIAQESENEGNSISATIEHGDNTRSAISSIAHTNLILATVLKHDLKPFERIYEQSLRWDPPAPRQLSWLMPAGTKLITS